MLTSCSLSIPASSPSQMWGVCLLPGGSVLPQHSSCIPVGWAWSAGSPCPCGGGTGCHPVPPTRDCSRRPGRGVQVVVGSSCHVHRLAQRGRRSCEVTFHRSGACAEIPGDVRVRRLRTTPKLPPPPSLAHSPALELCTRNNWEGAESLC